MAWRGTCSISLDVMILLFFFFFLINFFFFFFNDTATTEIYTLSLHDALPISLRPRAGGGADRLDADVAHQRANQPEGRRYRG